MPRSHIARTTTTLRPTKIPPSSFSRYPQPVLVRPYGSQSYGSGAGDPKGSNPQSQGANPATSNAEHPGPPPPDVGKGTGGGPTKKDGGGHHGESADTKASTTKTETGKARGGGSGGGGGGGGGTTRAGNGQSAQPKILQDDGPPPDEHLAEDVKAHNEEVAKRRDKPFESSDRQEGDQVGKGFWTGHGGADRQP